MGFVRLDSEALRQAVNDLGERELRVWLAIASFANDQGTCYPGIKRLCEITGYCADAMTDALGSLEAAGHIQFVRRGARDPYTGQQLPNVYAVVGVLVGDERPILLSSSTEESNTTILNTKNQHDQTTNTNSKHHHPTTTALNRDGTKADGDGSLHENQNAERQNAKNQRQREAQAQPPTANAVNTPPSSALPPQRQRVSYYKGSLKQWSAPLDEAGELAVERIRQAAENKLSVRAARRLVDVHGIADVDAALLQLALQENVKSKAGYLCWLLDGDGVDYAHDGKPAPKQPSGNDYITGPYAELFEH